MEIFGITLTGEHGVITTLIGVVFFVIYAVLKGDLVTGKRQDQIEKRHQGELADANERSRQWQEAWQASQNLATQQTDTIARLAQLTEVFEAFINALPKEGFGDDKSD